MKTCVVIPTYNEEASIGELVREIKSKGVDVLIVDDGSEDNTAVVALKNGSIVLKNERNLGKGFSLRRGFDFIVKNGYQTVITMDGDGQHLPIYIPKFLEFAKKKDVKIIVGNRMGPSSKMPVVRFLTNKIMSLIISFFCKQKIPDSQCGFRLMKEEILNKIDLFTKNFEIESEILIRAAKAGFKIESLPIKSVYKGQTSSIDPILDTLRFIRFILRVIFQ